jgi:hypothetical protein
MEIHNNTSKALSFLIFATFHKNTLIRRLYQCTGTGGVRANMHLMTTVNVFTLLNLKESGTVSQVTMLQGEQSGV